MPHSQQPPCMPPWPRQPSARPCRNMRYEGVLRGGETRCQSSNSPLKSPKNTWLPLRHILVLQRRCWMHEKRQQAHGFTSSGRQRKKNRANRRRLTSDTEFGISVALAKTARRTSYLCLSGTKKREACHLRIYFEQIQLGCICKL
jgi:hypothetical protein